MPAPTSSAAVGRIARALPTAYLDRACIGCTRQSSHASDATAWQRLSDGSHPSPPLTSDAWSVAMGVRVSRACVVDVSDEKKRCGRWRFNIRGDVVTDLRDLSLSARKSGYRWDGWLPVMNRVTVRAVIPMKVETISAASPGVGFLSDIIVRCMFELRKSSQNIDEHLRGAEMREISSRKSIRAADDCEERSESVKIGGGYELRIIEISLRLTSPRLPIEHERQPAPSERHYEFVDILRFDAVACVVGAGIAEFSSSKGGR